MENKNSDYAHLLLGQLFDRLLIPRSENHGTVSDINCPLADSPYTNLQMTINTSKSISHLLFDLEFVLILPVEVYHLVTEPSLIHRFLKVRKGREEHIIIATSQLNNRYLDSRMSTYS